MKHLRARVTQTLIAFIVCTSTASAQMNSMILAGPQNNAMGRVMALRAQSMRAQFDRRQAPPALAERAAPSASDADTLVLPSDSAVSKQAHDLYISGLEKTGGAAQASQIDHRLGPIRASFARLVGPYGLRADRLDDVMAAHMIVMWMAANQVARVPTPSDAQAVRRQMRRVFGAGPGTIAGPAERQLLAEYVMYETCMTVLVRNEVMSQPGLDKKVSDAVDAKMIGQGYSLRDLKLTEQGLVRG